MSGVGGFRGVSADQDARYANKTKKAMAQMKFPKELDEKVDVVELRKKPGWGKIKEWIAKRVTDLLGGLEEEVLIGFIYNQLEDDQKISAKEVHVSLVPFLEKNTSLFMKELWGMLAAANKTASGLPPEMEAETRARLAEKLLNDARVQAELAQRREAMVASLLPGPPGLPGPPPGPPPTGGGGGRASRWDSSARDAYPKRQEERAKADVKIEVKQEPSEARDRPRDRHRDRSRSRSRSRERDSGRDRDRNDRDRDRRDRGRNDRDGRDDRRDRDRDRDGGRGSRRSRSRSRSRSRDGATRERMRQQGRGGSRSPSRRDEPPSSADRGKRSGERKDNRDLSESDDEGHKRARGERDRKKSKKEKKEKKDKKDKKDKDREHDKKHNGGGGGSGDEGGGRGTGGEAGAGSGDGGSGGEEADEELAALKEKALEAAKLRRQSSGGEGPGGER